MRKRGFSFIEVLAALAILTVLSVSLMPLLSGLAASDQASRVRLDAWNAARAELLAVYLNDKSIPDEDKGSLDRTWETVTAGEAGKSLSWNRLSLTPAGSEKAVLTLDVRSGGPLR